MPIRNAVVFAKEEEGFEFCKVGGSGGLGQGSRDQGRGNIQEEGSVGKTGLRGQNRLDIPADFKACWNFGIWECVSQLAMFRAVGTR